MSAAILREAATLMRERAETAAPSPWHVDMNAVFGNVRCPPHPGDDETCYVADAIERDAEHIASWHPAVALAIADWLTVTAWWLEDEFPDDPDAPMDWSASTGTTAERVNAALAVAAAYLNTPTKETP